MAKKRANNKANKKKAAANKKLKGGTNPILSPKNKGKSSKTAKASVNKSKSKLKAKAKSVLSNEVWKRTTDTSGKLRVPRRRTAKLITQADTNRYQTLIKTISNYYKKAGTPLKRADLYKEYRRIRDNYSNISLAQLIPQFERLVIKGKGKRKFPNELKLGIPWYQFEDEMTANYSQRYFKLNDRIVLDLSCLTPRVANQDFPYTKIIKSYKRLYNNITFRQQVKGASPPPELEYDAARSKPSKGIYIFVLVDCPELPKAIIQKKRDKTNIPPTTGNVLVDQVLGIRQELEKQKTAIRKTQQLLTRAFSNNQMTYTQYSIEMEKLEEDLQEIDKKLGNL